MMPAPMHGVLVELWLYTAHEITHVRTGRGKTLRPGVTSSSRTQTAFVASLVRQIVQVRTVFRSHMPRLGLPRVQTVPSEPLMSLSARESDKSESGYVETQSTTTWESIRIKVEYLSVHSLYQRRLRLEASRRGLDLG